MKHFFLFLLFSFLFCSGNLFAQEDELHTVCYSYTYDQHGVLMKMVMEENNQTYTTNYKYEGNDLILELTDAGGTLLGITNEHFDTAGHKLSSQHITSGNVDTTSSYYKWNFSGMLITDSVVNSKTGLLKVERFIYNDTTLLEESIYYPSMRDTFITRYSFDASGRRLEARYFNKTGSLSISKYEYNKDGSLCLISEYSYFKQQSSYAHNVIRLEYAHGKLVHRHSGDKKLKDAIEYCDETFVYDKSGNLIRTCEKSLD